MGEGWSTEEDEINGTMTVVEAHVILARTSNPTQTALVAVVAMWGFFEAGLQ
jgi:hypothetical protein